MSPQEARGNQDQGRRPASGRPAQSGRPGQRPKTQSGQPRGGQSRPAPGGRGPKRGPGPAGRPSGPPRRFSPAAIAFSVVAVVIVVVVALVLVKVTGGSSNSNANGQAPVDSPAPTSLVAQVTAVTQAEANQVGVPSGLTAPKVATGQTALQKDGKPYAFFVGAEFCPYCAAERWAIVMAFSRFGTFTGLQQTTSSPWDTDPGTATFSFYGASYSSPDIAFDGIEHVSNDTNGLGTRTTKVQLTSQQSNLWSKYETHFGVQEGFPFIDFGNKVFIVSPSYNPAILSGLNQADIAAKLSNPSDPVTQAIVGTANYITAAICSVTGSSNSWCSASAVTQASKSMGLS